MIIENINEYISFLKKCEIDIKGKNKYVGEQRDDVVNNNELLCKAILTEVDRMKNALTFAEEFDEYNEQYKNYFNQRIESIKTSLGNIVKNGLYEYSLKNYLIQTSELADRLISDASFSAFEYFKRGSNNYILFGKNGSGKTSLINKIATDLIKTDSIVISANRNTNYNSSDTSHSDQDINLKMALQNNNKSIFILSKCVIREDYRQLNMLKDSDNSSKNTIVDEIKEIFDSLGMDRKFKIGEDERLYLYSDDCDPYLLDTGSDGEKSVLYLIMAILLVKDFSYVLIDEPETHLNGALAKKLFDILEEKRKTLIFVYSTHNISFVESRKNNKLLYLEKTNKKDKWEFKRVHDLSSLPLKCILEIEGTNDDVLFCEGESESSLDYPLYNLLFKNYHVIPSNGCDSVVFNTKSINKYKQSFRKKAIGIIDGDFRNEEDITSLNKANVNVLKVNEVENLYILEPCLKLMLERFPSTLSLSVMKSEIIAQIKNDTNKIIIDCMNKAFSRLHEGHKVKDISNMENELNGIYSKNAKALIEICEDFKKRLEEAITNSDYDLLMTLVPGKMLISYISSKIGMDKNTYAQALLKIISEDDSLKETLKSYI